MDTAIRCQVQFFPNSSSRNGQDVPPAVPKEEDLLDSAAPLTHEKFRKNTGTVFTALLRCSEVHIKCMIHRLSTAE